MNQIVKHMGGVSIPQEMLDRVDMNTLLNDFARDFNSLDDIKKARERHESRNALSRWWNKDELEKAQLDSVQLQARYAKSIGQLMVISIAQSQALNEQQRIMSEQQAHIKKQAESIQAANTVIHSQQQNLSKQQSSLEKLIKEYFLLKGLTTNEAKRLISIATDVKQTKAELLSRFDDLHGQFEEILASNRQSEAAISEFANQMSELSDNWATHKRESSERQRDIESQVSGIASRMSEHMNDIASIHKQNLLSLKTEQQVQLSVQLKYIKALATGLGITILALCISLFFTLN